MINLNQEWGRPKKHSPIVIFGAGSIVNDALFPAYKQAGFKVQGIYDPDIKKAKKLASKFNVSIFNTVEEACNQQNVIFDLATPPQAHASILEILPENSGVLIQKPMGSNLHEATKILEICNARSLKAALNFQLRFAPMMIALKDAISSGLLGEIVDFDAWLALDTPWSLWKFLENLPRVEILLHSIHYFDFIRSILGNPNGVKAKTLGFPGKKTSNTRTTAILDYGSDIRCALTINHNHNFGRKFQACEFRICGTKGAAYVQLGVNLNYPKGAPDILEINLGKEWVNIPLIGSWFIESFGNRMSQLQRYISGEESELIASVKDSWNTMALVEAAYKNSEDPGTLIPKYISR